MDTKDEYHQLPMEEDKDEFDVEDIKDQLDVLLQLPVDWCDFYQKFTMGVVLPLLVLLGCFFTWFYLTCTHTLPTILAPEPTEEIITVTSSNQIYFAVGYPILVFLISFILLFLYTTKAKKALKNWQERGNLDHLFIYKKSLWQWMLNLPHNENKINYAPLQSSTVLLQQVCSVITVVPYLTLACLFGGNSTLSVLTALYTGFSIAFGCLHLFPVKLASSDAAISKLLPANQFV